MLGPAITAIKAYVAANFTSLPVRWQNEPFADGTYELPASGGVPSTFVEAEIIGGRNAIAAFSAPGNRVFIHPGILRFYVVVPQGTGIDGAIASADLLAAAMERKEFGQSGSQTVRTGDFSTYDDVASYEDGNRFVLLASCPFEFFYTN